MLVFSESEPCERTSEPIRNDASHVDELIAIREATTGDLDAIGEMLRERVDASAGRVAAEVDNTISLIRYSLRSETVRRFFVAVVPDGRIVGMAGLQADGIAPELITDGERPIEAVMVHVRPLHRRRGVGQALLAEIEKSARELGYTTLLVVSGSRNRDGYPFWVERYGQPSRCDTNYFGSGEERTVWRWPLVQ